MTPEQAKQVQLSVAVAAAHLRGDTADRDSLLLDLGTPQRAADGFVMLAVAAVQVAAGLSEQQPKQVLDELQIRGEHLLPVDADQDAGRAITAALMANCPASAGGNVDVPTALTSVFDITVAALRRLDGLGGKDAEEWAQTLAVLAAKEASGPA
jgi:hypothetical protein